MLVLGIDPGTSVTGYALVEAREGNVRFLEAGVLRSRPTRPLPERILKLCDELEALLDRCAPESVAVEGLFTGRNARSALTLAQVRGAFLCCLARRELPVEEYSPAQVKKAVTGAGAASKEQVRAMVVRLLRLSKWDAPLDASDALAVALCHAQVSRYRQRLEQGIV